MTTTLIDLVESHYAAADSGDVDNIFNGFAPDFQWSEMLHSRYSGTYVGGQAVIDNVFAKIGNDFATFAFVPDVKVVDGDKVAVIGNYRGTYHDGSSFDVRTVHVWRGENGRIVSFEQVTDTARP